MEFSVIVFLVSICTLMFKVIYFFQNTTIPIVFLIIIVILLRAIFLWAKLKKSSYKDNEKTIRKYELILDTFFSITLLFFLWYISVLYINPELKIIKEILDIKQINLTDPDKITTNLTNLNYLLIQSNITLLGFMFVVVVFLFKDKKLKMGAINFGLVIFFLIGIISSILDSLSAIIYTYSNPLTETILVTMIEKTYSSIEYSLQSVLVPIVYFTLIIILTFANADSLLEVIEKKK